MSANDTGTSPAFSTEGGYIVFPVTVDANALIAQAFARLATQFPGWVPQEGQFATALLEVVAQIVSELAQQAAQVPLGVFRYYGGLVGVVPVGGAPATVPTTWVMVDDQGYAIPAGTYVTFPTSGSTVAYFTVANSVTVPPGSSATQPGEVILVASAAGSFANGFAGTYKVYDSLAYVAAITSTGPSSGGADPETDLAYLERLSGTLALLTPRPILPPDFAVLARNISGVARAVAIDNYNPADGSYGNERMVAVAGVDVDGNVLGAPLDAQVQAYLGALREVNFVVTMIDPAYSAISVTAQLVISPGASIAGVQAAATAAISAYLSPANWGGGNLTPPQWTNETTVRYLEIAAILGNVAGVDYIVSGSLTIGQGPTPAMGVADLALPVPLGLPKVGTLNIAVVAP